MKKVKLDNNTIKEALARMKIRMDKIEKGIKAVKCNLGMKDTDKIIPISKNISKKIEPTDKRA